jgi:hypothetical protein
MTIYLKKKHRDFKCWLETSGLYWVSLKQCTSIALSITSAFSYAPPSKEKVRHYLKPLHNPTYQSMYRHYSLQTIKHIPDMPLKPARRGKGSRRQIAPRLPDPRHTVVTHPPNVHCPRCRSFAWWVVFHHKSPTWFVMPALVNVPHSNTHVER